MFGSDRRISLHIAEKRNRHIIIGIPRTDKLVKYPYATNKKPASVRSHLLIVKLPPALLKDNLTS